jgi:hypothetical protein
MQRMVNCAAAMVVALLAGGCSSNNFLLYKEGRHFFVTSNRPELKRVLCDSGDMDRIVRDAKLPEPLQKELKEEVCASDKVKERLMATLDGMSREQRAALKTAFRENGYDINNIANC